MCIYWKRNHAFIFIFEVLLILLTGSLGCWNLFLLFEGKGGSTPSDMSPV